MCPCAWWGVWSHVLHKTLLMSWQKCPHYGKWVCALQGNWKVCYAFGPFWIWSLATEFQTRWKLFGKSGKSTFSEVASCWPKLCVPYSKWNKRIPVQKARPGWFPTWDVHMQLLSQRKAIWYPLSYRDCPVLIQLFPSSFWKLCAPFPTTPTTISWRQCYAPCFSR